MWTLRKTFRFEASHVLPQQGGKCARLHGHSWVLQVEVQGDRLAAAGARAGMVLDYGDISAIVKPLIDGYLDHYHLNDTTGLANPTSEELARWVYDRIAPYLDGLTAVTIHETCTSECRYARE